MRRSLADAAVDIGGGGTLHIVGNVGVDVHGKEMNMLAVSKAQQASVNKYVKNNYDRINVTMPKGEKKIIQAHAAALGESVNGFIVRSIRKRMERDNAAPAAEKKEVI